VHANLVYPSPSVKCATLSACRASRSFPP